MKTTFYPGFPAPEPRRISQIERYSEQLESFGVDVRCSFAGGATLDVRLAPDMPTLRLTDDAPPPVALTAVRTTLQICECISNYQRKQCQ